MEYFPPETLKSKGSLEQYEIIEQIGEGTYGVGCFAFFSVTRATSC
jgi:hypothetical protein